MRLSEKCLSNKAMRAFFKLKRLMFGAGITPSTSLKLFDQLIKPICLYGSEIWGTELLKPKDLTKLLSSLDTAECEKLNKSLCRFILGVHKKSQVNAIRGELGRYPIALDIIANILTYRDYIASKDENSLLYKAYLTNQQIL